MNHSTFARSLLPPPPRNKMPPPRNPEDAIASRHLKRLGDTFICNSQKGSDHRLDESADDVTAAGGGRIGSRKVSLMRRHPSARNALYAISAIFHPPGVTNTRQDGDAAPTFSANRRWRQRVASLGATSTGVHALPPGSLFGSANTACKPEHPSTDLARAASVDDGSVMLQLHASQAPGNTHRHRRGGSDVSTVRRASEKAPCLSIGQPHGRDKGKLNQRPSHSGPCVSRSTSCLGSSTCGSSLVSLDLSEWGIRCTTSLLARRPGGKSTRSEAAKAESDSVVAQAAELMASTALRRRTLRDHAERAAQVLAQEHTKLLLLLGRRDNLESDIEDMLELADAARDKAQQVRLNLLSMPTANREGTAAVSPSTGSKDPHDRDISSGRAAGRVNTAPSLDLASVRRELRKLSTKLLRSGATDLDPTQLRRLVDQLEDHLDMVAEVLEEEVSDVAATDSEAQSPRVAVGAAAAAAPPPRNQTLRRRLERTKKGQKDLLEVSSNLTRMEWLVESTDMELVTDLGQSQTTETCEGRASMAGEVAGAEGHDGNPLAAHEGTAAVVMRDTPHQSLSYATLNGPSPTVTPTATTRKLGAADLPPQGDHRISIDTTTSEPSMVPFSLNNLIGDSKASGSSAAAGLPPANGQQAPLSGPKGPNATTSTPFSAHSHRLNLLSFMSEALGRCGLERLNAANLLQKRPPSAPSKQPQRQVLLFGEHDGQEELDGAKDEEGHAHDSFVQSTGLQEGDDRVQSGTRGSAPGVRRPPSGASAAMTPNRGRSQPSAADDLPDKRLHSPRATPIKQNQHSSTTCRDEKLMAGAKLHNLRSGLLHDLYELCAMHNYVQLIEARRRELTKGAGKGNAEYAAEMEQKLAEHRLQLEAMRRAREEAAALTQEWEQCSSMLRTGSSSRAIASANSQRTVASDHGQGRRPNSGADLGSGASSSGARVGETRPSTMAALQKRHAEKAAPTSEETELLREYLADTGLLFTVIGVRRGHHSSAVNGTVGGAENAGAGSAGTHNTKRASKRDANRNGTGEPDSFLYYELRVEKTLPASPLTLKDAAPASGGPPPAFQSAATVAAVVQISSRRLRNLNMTVDAGARVKEVASGAVATLNVTHGDPPRLLLTLTPAKSHKIVSYEQAFHFSAEDALDGTEPQPQLPHDMWEAGSTASAVFAFPTGDRVGRSVSRNSSLDSGRVQPVEQTPAMTGSAAHGGSETSRTLDAGAAGKRRAKEAAAAESREISRRESRGKAHTPGAWQPVAMADTKAARKSSRPGAPASRVPIGAGLQSLHTSLNASRSSLATPAKLPQSPPLSLAPRSIDEWGVPHAHTEMEAVEKNAVVLTVLQAGGESDAAAEGARSEGGEAEASAVEQLLAAIPDSEALRLVDEWRSLNAAASAREGAAGRGVAAGSGTADTRGSSAVDALAAEILCQAMMDGANGETDAAGGMAGAKGSSARPDDFRDGVGREALTNSALLLNEEGMPAASLLRLRASASEGARGSASLVRSHEADKGVSPLSPAPDFDATHLSPSPKQGRLEDEQAPGRRLSGGRWALEASSFQAPRVFKSARRPAEKPGKMQAPLLTITSQSRPLPATDVENYDRGLFRFDYTDVGSADASTVPPLPAMKPPTPHKGTRSGTRYRAHPLTPSAAAAAPTSGPSLPSQDNEPKRDEAELETSLSPPVVVIERKSGRAKPHVLLPRQAAESVLGPSLRDIARDRLVSGGHERHVGRQGTEAPGVAAHTTIDTASASLQSTLAAAHSVLPTTGAAAAAAADAQTVSHVQKFMQAVKSEYSRQGTTPGGAVKGRANKSSSHVAGGAAGLAMRTELDQLQDDAQELFLIDPLRFDTVISELMEQAARTLAQEFAGKAPPQPPMKEGTSGEMAGAAQASSHPGPFQAMRDREPHARGGADGLSGTGAAATAASFTKERPSRASFSVPSMLVQFDEPEEGGEERGCGQGVGLRVSQMLLSNAATKKRGSRADSSGGGVSVVPPLSSRSMLASTHAHLSRIALIAPVGEDGSADQLLPSLMSLPSQSPARRRETHTLIMKDGAIDQAAANRRASCADAAAEVERILYEQMKAQLLLRAIIAKMKEMWLTKQKHAEAKHRERIANYRQRLMRRALAAAWPLERQRMVHLHKLIYLLDRQAGRVHGWLPHYSDSNVLIGASSFAQLSRSMGVGRLPAASNGAHACLASWYRRRDQVALDAAVDSDGTAAAHVCPRYLHYLPQRRMYRYMRLAKERRMLPLRLVRTDIHQSHSRHILIGYEKVALDAIEEGEDGSQACVRTGGWPQRNVLRRRHGGADDRAAPFQKAHYEDMRTRGERERYRRRLQCAAAFQRVSKMHSPRTRQDAFLPFPLH
ncbi:hypothetical protein LSCM1_03197 [Leishmania martiniquensis]|uniref:Uncharacterized protein n=1 Tax=Leishmania martiniquensis TaxID=1580590 RepID=A0A836HCM0_9TRYP|nr:hypothetical protein LSCM1_03197 [Leishmania martiniquensis]